MAKQLSADDIAHYQRIVVALAETIRLMREIDEVIDLLVKWEDEQEAERWVHGRRRDVATSQPNPAAPVPSRRG